MKFEAEPKAQTVGCYVLTDAATRAWEVINRGASSAAGSFFWIGGPAGVGKTHFLNYVLSLERSTGARSADEERCLTLTLAASSGAGPAQLEAALLERLARELGSDKRTTALWRGLGNAEGLRIALSEAHRLGVRRLTLAVDLGDCDPSPAFDYLKAVAAIIKSSRPLPAMMLVAGRSRAPDYAVSLDVAPHGEQEAMLAGVARARELMPAAHELIDDFYGDAQGESEGAFPFRFDALRALLALAAPGCGVGDLARLARDALGPNEHSRNMALRRLVLPSDLTASGALARRIESLLGEAGRTALKAGYAAALSAGDDDADLARRIVDSLALAYFDERELDLEQLCAALPKQVGEMVPRVRVLLERLAQAAKGAIHFDGRSARFNPRLPNAHQLVLFNAAVPVLRRLDPSLATAQEADDLELMLRRLRDAMAEALELARNVGEKLTASALAERAEIPPRYARRLGEFIALLSQGRAALLEAAADPGRAEQLTDTFEAFRALTGAAALAPRLLVMRRYLEDTGLLDGEGLGPSGTASGQIASDTQEQPGLDEPAPLAALRIQARLSAVELNFRLLFASQGAFDAAEARFAKFRAEYAQHYHAAHKQWRAQMTRLERLAHDASALLEALTRLNSIASLGPPDGANLTAELASCARQIVVCDQPSHSPPEQGARCPRCGYVLGATPPPLAHTLEAIQRAVQTKLARLSQSAIRRLIKAHDDRGRMEGFLKIVQAAQTDALARVLDDELTAYLRRLLDEGPALERALVGQTLAPATLETGLFRGRRRARAVYQRAAAVHRLRQKPPPHPK